VEFVGLGQVLGEFGGGNTSLSECWIGLKCVLSLPFEVDEDDDKDGGIDDRRLRDCWVVNRFVLDSIEPGEGDSLENGKVLSVVAWKTQIRREYFSHQISA
jgi:hypothetical protein